MTGLAVAHRESATPDGVLVQEAAAGSGVSYGALYDRYAEQLYNYCLRLTGSTEDAADATQEAFLNVLRRLQEDDRPVLEFSSYLFAAARNESYALMKRRARLQPSELLPEEPGRMADVETEPERAVLLRDSQEAVRAANAKLPPRHREVLALRELGDRSYDEIGRIMGISENGAAQLIWRARTKLREAMTAGAVASVVATSEECERAQLLLSRIQDGEPVDELDRLWLDEHLDQCGKCRAAESVLLEVGASYRAWLPVVAIAGLKADTLTAAGQIVGADWSGAGAASGGAAAGGSAGGAAATVATLAVLGVGLSATLHEDATLERKVRDQFQPPAASAPAPEAKARPEARAARRVAQVRRRALGPPPQPQFDAAAAPRPAPPAVPRVNIPAEPTPRPGERAPRRDSPRPPAEPRTEPPAESAPAPEPPAVIPPPPPQAAPCDWSGGDGQGSGPGGCPPGHGGTPPGQGGTPPGQAKVPPGR